MNISSKPTAWSFGGRSIRLAAIGDVCRAFSTSEKATDRKSLRCLLAIFFLLSLTPILAFSSNLFLGFADGLSLENQSLTLPLINAQGYLLAVYFAFGKQSFARRSIVQLVCFALLAIEATWIHATLMDLRDPTFYLRFFAQNVVVFVIPPVAVSVVLLLVRPLFSFRGGHERYSILHMMYFTLLVAIVMTTVRYNPFAKYLLDWSALGSWSVCNASLAFSFYIVLLAGSVYLRALGASAVVAILGYQIGSIASSSPWEYVNILLPWFVYVPILYFLKSDMRPARDSTSLVANVGGENLEQE